jgi:hypothetical protein
LINGQVVGSAPILIENIRPGRVQIQAHLTGYRQWGKNIVVQPQETSVVTLILAKSLRGGESQ